MINRLIASSLRNRGAVLAVYAALAVWGAWAAATAPVDAIPDLSDNQVIVFTDWTGHAAQEVEDQVTYPVTTTLQGLPGVRVIRSQSAFGFSMIYVVFEDGTDLYFARTRVLERLNLVAARLPAGVAPTLGPDATGVGHVLWYTVEGPGRSLRELRSIQDWFVRYQLNAVPGVAEDASVGGTVQQYQIDVDPERLRAYGIPLSAVVSAVRASNRNVGGNVLEANGAWSVIRGLGLVESTADLENILIGGGGGVPVFVKQVADVRVGDAFRVASLVKGTHEAVGGVIVARSGENARAVIERVKARIAQIEPGLPEGVRIVPFYDRSDADRSHGRHASDCARRRSPPGHARARAVPAALPLDPDRHPPVATRRADGVSRDALRRPVVEHHEPRRHRDRDRRAGRCGDRRHRERVPVRRTARRGSAGPRSRPSDRAANPRVWWAGPSSSRWPSSCWPSCRSLR